MNIQDNEPDDWSEVSEEEERPGSDQLKKAEPFGKVALSIIIGCGAIWAALKIWQLFIR